MLIVAVIFLLVSGRSFAQNEVELPPVGSDLIPEYRGDEALNSLNGTYELHLPDLDVTAYVDAGTNAIYISNSSGTFTIPITQQALNEAGISLAEFQQIMTGPGNNFLATWTAPANVLGDPIAVQKGEMISSGEMFPCAFVPCSPWNENHYGSFDPFGPGPNVGPSVFWDRVESGGGDNQAPPRRVKKKETWLAQESKPTVNLGPRRPLVQDWFARP